MPSITGPDAAKLQAMDDARQQAEQDRDRFFDLSLDMCCIASSDGYFKRVNPAFTRTLGWNSEELLSRPFLEFVHPEDQNATLREVERLVVAGETVLRFENRYRHRDGSWRQLNWSSVPQADGMMYATARDVTEQRRLEGELRNSEQKLEITLNSIGDAVLATDDQRRITRMNPVAEKLTGWTQAEALGRPIDDVFRIIDERTGEPAVIPVDDVLATGTVYGLANHTALIARDGTRRSIADSAAPIRGPRGEILGVVLVFRDVTQERLAALRQEQLHEELERRVRERTAELADSERFNRCTLDALTAHVAVVDETGTIVSVNAAWTKFAEANRAVPQAISVGANYLAVCDRAAAAGDADAAQVAQALRNVLGGGTAEWEFEYPCHSADEHRWFYCRITRFGAEGPGRIVVAHGNITPLRVAERELEQSRSQFHQLFRNVPEGIAIVDRRGTIVDANPELERILGWTHEELQGQPVEILVPHDQRPQHVRDREKFFEAPVTHQMGIDRSRLFGLHKDGSKVALDIRLCPLWTDDEPLVAAMIRDVTERLHSEETLQNSERRFRMLFENTKDALLTAAPPNWQFTSGNPATLRMFRVRDEAEFKTLGPWSLSPEFQPDGRPSAQLIEANIAKAMRDGVHFFEWTHRRLDGEEFPATVQITRMELDGVAQLQATIRDITTEKQVLDRLHETAEKLQEANVTINQERAELAERVAQRTAELTEANQRLKQVSRAKSEFLAAMSHELRTPLNGILGMNELLLATELSARQREFVEASLSSGKLLAQLINDVLDLSKIEAGALDLDEQICSLDAIVYDVVAMFSPVARQRGLTLNCRVAPDLSVTVRCDDHRLRQILTNLVGNALKFTSSGSVTIDVARQGQNNGHALARFTVTDTGIGIPEERRHRLFQSFSQVDSSTTRRYGGTGLGLSICKQLAELMGGRIGLESQVGTGSTFWVEISLEIIGQDESRKRQARSLRGLRVLTPAGRDEQRRQIEEHLQAWGCSVQPVTTLDEAVYGFLGSKAGSSTVLLADLQWFDDGKPEVLQRLEESFDIPVIALGATPDDATTEQLRRFGIRHVLHDPVRPSDLFDALVSVVSTNEPFGSDAAALPPVAHSPLCGHVLVVEDNHINQLYVVELLKHFGCTYDVAVNGGEALLALERGNYDLVLMDCQMPEMDGFTATREIRRRQSVRQLPARLPVIALTANALKGDRERCLKAGMDDYLGKPVESAALRAMLEKYLQPSLRPEGSDAASEGSRP